VERRWRVRAGLPAQHESERQCGGHSRRDRQRSDQTPSANPRGRRSRDPGRRRYSRQCLQVEREVARRVEALLRVLLERVPDDSVEPGMDVAVRGGEVRGLFRQDRRDRVGRGVALERAAARDHLVEDRPEGEDVGPLVRRATAHLLGRHVAHGPQHDAGLRAHGSRGEVGLLRAAGFRLLELCETEVEDLDSPVPRHEQVLGLEVPVDDPLLVRRGEPPRDLDRVVERFAHRERSGGETAAQRFAFEKLRDDVRGAVVRSDVVDRGDVGMVQDSRGPSFVLEAAESIRIARKRRGQHLDGDFAPQPRILRAIDLPHPARAKRRDDLVGTQTTAGGETHFASLTRKRCDTIRRNV